MRVAIKVSLAAVVALLYSIAALSVLVGARGTPSFAPNTFQAYLLATAGAALATFIGVQLGITVSTTGDNLRLRVQAGMGSTSNTLTNVDLLLWLDVLVFVVFGLAFAVFALWPGLLAPGSDGQALANAPTYVQTQAEAFVAITIAALAALGSSIKQ